MMRILCYVVAVDRRPLWLLPNTAAGIIFRPILASVAIQSQLSYDSSTFLALSFNLSVNSLLSVR